MLCALGALRLELECPHNFGELPPRSNLRDILATGADLVAFSGGKAIRGPQATGILCGRRELVSAAALQTLDLDDHPELWEPPAGLILRDRLPGSDSAPITWVPADAGASETTPSSCLRK